MFQFIVRRRFLALGLVALLGAALASGCDDDEVIIGPGAFPDVSGTWAGQYRVTGCTLSGATDAFFCSELFSVNTSLILDLDLDQDGPDLFGTLAQGELLGDVFGSVDQLGVVRIEEGLLEDDEGLLASEVNAWQTGLVGDSLQGSWRFFIEDLQNQGFGGATVDASIKMFGPSVAQFFGCASAGNLTPNGQISEELRSGDCQLTGSLFDDQLADETYFDVYALTGAAGDSLEVTLRSAAIDAVLLVADLDEVVLGWDDDISVDERDAALTIVFGAAETLLLIATSYEPGETGPYTLQAVREGVVPVAQLAPRARVLGQVGSLKAAERAATAVPADPYREALRQKLIRPRR